MHTLEYMLFVLAARIERETGDKGLADDARRLALISHNLAVDEPDQELQALHKEWHEKFDSLIIGEGQRVLTSRFDDALAFAAQLHRSQIRKGTSIPYITHLMTVSAIVLEHGGDEDAAIGALLHDAAEDQGGEPTLVLIRERYGDKVAKIVADCTDAWADPKPDWRPRKEAYISSLDHKQDPSLLVSLADKSHNVRAILADYNVIGDELWSRFTGGRDGTLWYYKQLAEAFLRLRPGRLATDFKESVDELVQTSTRIGR